MNFPETRSGAEGQRSSYDTPTNFCSQRNSFFCDRRFDGRNNRASSSFSNYEDGVLNVTTSSQNHVVDLTSSRTSSTIPGRIERAGEDQVDDIAEALQALSFQQREEVYDDIHGTGCYEQDEDATMISNCLKTIEECLQLQLEIDKLKSTRSALLVAMEQNPAYVQDVSFQMAFLRAFEWNPKNAADRIVRFLEKKKELFGMEQLTKDITMNDLDENDKASLSLGGIQVVPLRDRSGRQIVTVIPSLWGYRDVKNMVRAMYYVMMSISKNDIEAQRKGIVEIFYKVGFHKTDFYLMQNLQQLRDVFPLRMAAIHACSDSPTLLALVKFLRPWMSQLERSRIRIHCGKSMEVQYELQGYGIPIEALPIDSSGGTNDFQKIWVEQRRQIEYDNRHSQIPAASLNHRKAKPTVIDKLETVIPAPTSCSIPLSLLLPEPNDVILGRGKGCDQHVGNINFRQYLQRPEILKKFQSAPKYVKIEYVEQIKATLKQDLGVRFLKRDGSSIFFQVADDAAITQKISRTFRRLVQYNQKKESQGSSA